MTISNSNHDARCLVCDLAISAKRKFCSTKCKGRFHQNNSYDKQQARAWERKKYFVELAGSQCFHCGYNKNLAALSFHHVQPTDKLFPLDARSMSNRNMETLKQEFDKCLLLCLNCHAELHHPTHSTP